MSEKDIKDTISFSYRDE